MKPAVPAERDKSNQSDVLSGAMTGQTNSPEAEPMRDETPAETKARHRAGDPMSRRTFLASGSAFGMAVAGYGSGAGFSPFLSQASRAGASVSAAELVQQDMALVNGKIHTMDRSRRVVSQALIQNGRFTAVGNNVSRRGNVKVIDLKGHTVVPGLIDAHDHIVLVGNRPGRHVLLEDVFTLQDVVTRYQSVAAGIPSGEFIMTIGPLASMQFSEQRLPNLSELDAVNRPVYINAAQGGVRTNSLGKTWLEARGVTVAADGTVAAGAAGAILALRLLREQFLTPDVRQRNSFEALRYYAGLGIPTHLDNGAFQSEVPSGGVANENTSTMHNPFLAWPLRGGCRRGSGSTTCTRIRPTIQRCRRCRQG